jgi:hypothetical protein
MVSAVPETIPKVPGTSHHTAGSPQTTSQNVSRQGQVQGWNISESIRKRESIQKLPDNSPEAEAIIGHFQLYN